MTHGKTRVPDKTFVLSVSRLQVRRTVVLVSHLEVLSAQGQDRDDDSPVPLTGRSCIPVC